MPSSVYVDYNHMALCYGNSVSQLTASLTSLNVNLEFCRHEVCLFINMPVLKKITLLQACIVISFLVCREI